MNKLTKGICIFLSIILFIQQGAVIQAKENNPAERTTATEEYMNPFYEKTQKN